MSYIRGKEGTMERTDFSHFGKSFQEALCLLILEDRPFADQIMEVFDITFLELGYLRLFTSKIMNYREKYGVHPTKKIMSTVIKSDMDKENEAIQKQVRDYFARVLAAGTLKDSEFIKDKALDFCRKQKLKGALGAQALLKGVNVVHYTLELSDTTIASRYDSCITGVSLNDLFSFKELIYEKVQDVKGQLIVKEYPTKSASTRTIKNHLEKLVNRGVEPGLIIVDYGDLLRPVTVRKEKRTELESIYEEMRSIAQEFQCPVWTASQTNRSGLNAEVITMESISEAFSKCFVADLIFTVSRTMEDKTSNTGRMYVAKNRNGPDGLVYPIFMDTSNVKIRVLPPSDDEEDELTAKSQSDILKEKYKKFRSQQRESA